MLHFPHEVSVSWSDIIQMEQEKEGSHCLESGCLRSTWATGDITKGSFPQLCTPYQSLYERTDKGESNKGWTFLICARLADAARYGTSKLKSKSQCRPLPFDSDCTGGMRHIDKSADHDFSFFIFMVISLCFTKALDQGGGFNIHWHWSSGTVISINGRSISHMGWLKPPETCYLCGRVYELRNWMYIACCCRRIPCSVRSEPPPADLVPWELPPAQTEDR